MFYLVLADVYVCISILDYIFRLIIEDLFLFLKIFLMLLICIGRSADNAGVIVNPKGEMKGK